MRKTNMQFCAPKMNSSELCFSLFIRTFANWRVNGMEVVKENSTTHANGPNRLILLLRKPQKWLLTQSQRDWIDLKSTLCAIKSNHDRVKISGNYFLSYLIFMLFSMSPLPMALMVINQNRWPVQFFYGYFFTNVASFFNIFIQNQNRFYKITAKVALDTQTFWFRKSIFGWNWLL